MSADADVPRWSIAPYSLVADVVAAANFYRDRLGFSYERFWGDPPTFCLVRRAGVTVMLSGAAGGSAGRPNRSADPEGGAWDACLWIDDADALRAELLSRGVTLAREICDQPYGCRDFELDDLDGYRLCCGHDLEGG